jgi:tetratricopeptide (TPR) repeat protein
MQTPPAIEAVRDVPLAAPVGRQQRQYFEALALYTADRYAKALVAFDALLAIPDLDDAVRGRTLNSRANCCRITGRLEEAVAGFRASLAVWRRLGNRLREGLALLNLAIVDYQLQDYDDAESSLILAMRCFEETGATRWLAAAQNELGLVYRDQGRWVEALASFETAAAQYRTEKSLDTLGRVLNNIGEVLLFQGAFEEAEAAFLEALATMRTRLYVVDAHLNLGLTHQVAGNLPKAQAAFQAALDLAQEIGRRDTLAQVHYRLGDALHRLNEPVAALVQFEAAASVIESTREPLTEEDLKISLLGRWQQVYETLVLHYLATGRPAEAFAWAERSRARAFADAVTDEEIGDWISEIRDSESDLHYPVANIQSLISNLQAGLPAHSTMLCYFTTGVLERDVPLLQALPAESSLREHLLTPARTLLFALTKDNLTAHEGRPGTC